MQKYLIFALILISNAIAAQKIDSTYLTLDSIVVESRNIKIKDLSNPFVVSSIAAKQITQNGARTTPEALIGTSGIFLQKTNHGGGSAFIRGLTGNQTLMVIDGIRLNNSTFRYGPNQYLNTIDMYTLEKIDVLKGIGAIEYGSDAMGGVINLTTKEAAIAKEKIGLERSFLCCIEKSTFIKSASILELFSLLNEDNQSIKAYLSSIETVSFLKSAVI